MAADQTLSLQELLRSVKAEAVLKDAAIKALRRENARLVSLVQPQATMAMTPSSGGQPGTGAGQPLAQRLGMTSPLPGATTSPVASASSGAGLRAGGDRLGWAAMPVAATPAAAAPGSPVAGLQQPQQPQQFSFTSPTAASSAPSYIPLAGAQQQQSGGTSAATVSPAFSAATSGRALGSLGSVSPASSLSQAAAALSSQLRVPTGGGVVAAAGQLDDQRLSFLLELVVERRITAAQAQQVRHV